MLSRCIECLFQQTLRAHRVVIVDNASQDGSLETVGREDQVEIIRLPSNEGFARANNLAIRQVDDCEYVVLLNPDAFPEPGWLDALVRAASTHPECASFGSQMRMADAPSRLDGIGDAYHVSGAAWRAFHAALVRDAREAIGQAGEIFSACAAAALYRREAVLAAGGFDESYFCYFEDVDLGFRLRLLGFRCRYVPEAVVYHAGSASSGYGSEFAVYHGNRNLVWTFFKNMPWLMLVRYVPQHLFFNAAALCFARRPAAVLRAKWDAVRGLGAAFRQRRMVQRTRRVSNRQLAASMSTGWMAPYSRHLRTRQALRDMRVERPVESAATK
jgi:GT2 family glycosyltransferase